MNTPSSEQDKRSEDDEQVVVAPNTTGDDSETVEELRDYKTRIREANQKVMERKHRLDELKEQVKDAKKAWEGAQVMLSDLIAEEKEEYPLFDKKNGTSQAVENDAWRAVHISELELPEKILEALLEAKPRPLETIGDLSDYWEKHQLIDVHGIGPAKAQKIDEALTQFWQNHPEYCTKSPTESNGVVAVVNTGQQNGEEDWEEAEWDEEDDDED